MFAGIIYIIFANLIMSAFTQDPEVIRIGAVYVRIQAITYGFIGLSIVLGRGFSGAGDTLPPMVFTGISLLGFAIPAVIVMANWLGLIGIWIGIAASNVVQAAMMAFWFLRGKWKEKEV